VYSIRAYRSRAGSGAAAIKALERLFVLELEFQRRLRTEVGPAVDTEGLHTSYALQYGYELLLRSVGRVKAPELEALGERYFLIADARDVLGARDSLMEILGVPPLGNRGVMNAADRRFSC
jgi:hypothetical protein